MGIVLRIAYPSCMILGFLLIYTACFLYEPEEHQLQARLENAWVRVDDWRLRATSRHLAFMKHFAASVTHLLNAAFGPEL